MHIRRMIFLFLVAAAFGYFVYEARGVLFPPALVIYEPTDGAVFTTTRIHIAGRTNADGHVLVNGKEFVADSEGVFEGTMTLRSGYNELGFLVRDRFQNETRRVLQVFVR